MSPFTLENRVALVTGSSTGLGKETAACLGRAGAKIAINYANNKKRAESTLAEFHEMGLTAELFQANVTSAEDIDSMATAIEQSLGPIDIAVLNATPAQPLKPIEEYDWDFYQQMLDFFVKSPYLLARRLLPGMKERKYGRLINITSESFLARRCTIFSLCCSQRWPDRVVTQHGKRTRSSWHHGQHGCSWMGANGEA